MLIKRPKKTVNPYHKVQGIALIQVLLITAILSVLALYLTQTARDQITIAQWLDDKTNAQVALHSAESHLLFSLLTEPFLAEQISQQTNNEENNTSLPFPLRNNWNFFGQAFAINAQTQASIQDQSGLIHAHYPLINVLNALISSQGFSEIETNVIIDNLLDWQDLDNIARVNGNEQQSQNKVIRNGAVSSLFDLGHIEAIPPRLMPVLLANLTIYHRGNFNPMNASVELLSALTSPALAEQVKVLRSSKQLTKQNFTELTGIKEDEEIYFYPSNYLSVKLISKVGDSVAHKTMIIKVQPNAGNNISPINMYLNRS
jgi:general secretion pathway protein K